MKQVFDVSDVAALESYYRKQLLEMSKQATLPQKPQQVTTTQKQSAEVATPAPVIPAKEPAAQAEQPKKPPMQEEKQTVPPKKEESKPQLKFFDPPRADFRREGMLQRAGSDSQPPKRGFLPEVPAVLRASAMVPQSGKPGYGSIKVRVNTALGALPVKGAVVIIETADAENRQLVEYLVTDLSGNTPVSKPLPTVSKSESLRPEGDQTPYAAYRVTVRAAGYSPFTAEKVLVFDGELSLVEASLQPLYSSNKEGNANA